ncbi:hypothetical protein ABW20_dc0101411 [Dactylellina cionopaga]|nr:hypothetical protein ABW20_dc0101411 [Dactylellina cionopaga]
MSSGFVSSGQLDSTTGFTEPRESNTDDVSKSVPEPTGVDAWSAADAAVKAAKERAAANSGLIGSQEDGKSLFEVLQANKARKQEAFEEKLKFKNQFRTLDESEIEFLDTIVSEQRAEEDARKKEIETKLDDFRKLQYEADHDPTTTDLTVAGESNSTWAVPARRKRKKEKEKDNQLAANLKLRKMSDGSKKDSTLSPKENPKPTEDAPKVEIPKNTPSISAPSPNKQASPPSKPTVEDKTSVAEAAKPTTGLGGLVAYGSDSDDD